ncbi:MAG: hypothetical protein Q7T82_16260 [Armatimonadota bacterium]|nr:hypothetical protein [Armatimonadota bacterium]
MASPRMLFIDGHHITETRRLTRRMRAAEKHPGGPVIVPDKPWEGRGFWAKNSAVFDPADGLFKIWYQVGEKTCLAVSEDGVSFTKPNLGLVEHEGSRDNNIVEGGAMQVLYGGDDFGDLPTDRTYQGVNWNAELGQFVVTSPDGLRWSVGDGIHIPGAGDTFVAVKSTSPLTGHDATGLPGYPVSDGLPRYLGVVRLCCPVGRFDGSSDIRPTRRVQALTVSEDLRTWSRPARILTPDAVDDEMAQGRVESAVADGSLPHDCLEDRRCEFYTMLIVPYEDLYLGMLQVFDASYEFHRMGGNNQSGPLDIQLVVSRDLLDWRRLGDRAAFIPRGAASDFDFAAACYPSLPIVKDGRLLIYYTGTILTHAGTRDKDYYQRLLDRVDSGEAPGTHAIGLATLRRDGFVSLDAGDEWGYVLTKPFTWPRAGTLHLNADAQGGEVRVTVCEPDGTSVPGYEESRPLTGDLLDGVVKWKQMDNSRSAPLHTHGAVEEAPALGGAGLEPGDKVRLRIAARNAKLYSYWFD